MSSLFDGQVPPGFSQERIAEVATRLFQLQPGDQTTLSPSHPQGPAHLELPNHLPEGFSTHVAPREGFGGLRSFVDHVQQSPFTLESDSSRTGRPVAPPTRYGQHDGTHTGDTTSQAGRTFPQVGRSALHGGSPWGSSAYASRPFDVSSIRRDFPILRARQFQHSPRRPLTRGPLDRRVRKSSRHSPPVPGSFFAQRNRVCSRNDGRHQPRCEDMGAEVPGPRR
jgi:hypothetical protein